MGSRRECRLTSLVRVVADHAALYPRVILLYRSVVVPVDCATSAVMSPSKLRERRNPTQMPLTTLHRWLRDRRGAPCSRYTPGARRALQGRSPAPELPQRGRRLGCSAGEGAEPLSRVPRDAGAGPCSGAEPDEGRAHPRWPVSTVLRCGLRVSRSGSGWGGSEGLGSGADVAGGRIVPQEAHYRAEGTHDPTVSGVDWPGVLAPGGIVVLGMGSSSGRRRWRHTGHRPLLYY